MSVVTRLRRVPEASFLGAIIEAATGGSRVVDAYTAIVTKGDERCSPAGPGNATGAGA